MYRDLKRNQDTVEEAAIYEKIGEVKPTLGTIDTTQNVAYSHIQELKSIM